MSWMGNTGRSKKLVTCHTQNGTSEISRFGDFLYFFGLAGVIQSDFMTSSSYMVFSSVRTLIGAESWSVCTDIRTEISSFSFEQRRSLKLGGRVFTLDSTIQVVLNVFQGLSRIFIYCLICLVDELCVVALS